jgi:hypothetical protein
VLSFFIRFSSLLGLVVVYVNIKGSSSALQSLELARCIGLKSKLKSTFTLDCYCIMLLRYCLIRRKLVVLRENS